MSLNGLRREWLIFRVGMANGKRQKTSSGPRDQNFASAAVGRRNSSPTEGPILGENETKSDERSRGWSTTSEICKIIELMKFDLHDRAIEAAQLVLQRLSQAAATGKS